MHGRRPFRSQPVAYPGPNGYDNLKNRTWSDLFCYRDSVQTNKNGERLHDPDP